MKKKLVALALSVSLISGCSSIVSKTDYAVAINTNPGGANFYITNRAGQKVESGVTPSTVTLKSSAGYFKGETYTLVFNKEGYSEKSHTFTSSVDGWYFGNLLFGGVIGMLIVDPATGAMYNLPDRVDVPLSEEGTDTITIATIDSLTEEQKALLVKI